MNKTTTTMFFSGGPWDGDTRALADPPLIIPVPGALTEFGYKRYGLDQYEWERCIHVTPRSQPVGWYGLDAQCVSPPIQAAPPPTLDITGRGDSPQLSPSTPSISKVFKWVWGIMAGIAVMIFALEVLGRMEIQFDQEADQAKEKVIEKATREIQAKTAALPASTPAPTPDPDPIRPLPSGFGGVLRNDRGEIMNPLPPLPAPTPEVRRAQPAEDFEADIRSKPPLQEGTVHMPYGENVHVKVWGRLPDQESLPPTDNHIGDAFQIGKDLFVWVVPQGGHAQWIDPVIR